MFILLWVIVYAVSFSLIFGGTATLDAMEAGDASFGVAATIGFAILGLFVIGSFIPALAVQVRRFHDQDKSGWMVLLNFIPYIGGLIVLIFMCLEGTRGENSYGPDPKGMSDADVFS